MSGAPAQCPRIDELNDETTSSGCGYRRVDVRHVSEVGDKVANDHNATHHTALFRWAIVPLSVLLCVVQAVITVSASNMAGQLISSTLITVIGLGFLMALAIAINPLIRLVGRGRVRPMGRAELLAIIASLMVTAGISSFGLSDVLVPIIAGPWNAEWNTPQRGWDTQLHPYLNRDLYITDPKAIRLFREGFADSPAQDAPWSEWLAYYQSVVVRIPWAIWLYPLGAWMIFVAGCYGMFWSLSYLVLDLWSRREKLIFPLTKLPEALLPEEGSSVSMVPAMVRRPQFWLGFALSFTVLAHNAAAAANWTPLARLPLGLGSADINAMFEATSLAGLVGGGPMLIIFTCIGIAFLLPLEVSFSIWFYFIVGRILILIMVFQGHGNNFADFPSDWIWVQNPLSTLGMGGLLLFSAVTLWRAARTVVRMPSSNGNDRPTNGRSPRPVLPAIGLAVSFIIVTIWLCWNRLPPHWAILVTGFLVLLTLGLMRIVAETGVFWIQSNAGFFHFYKMLGLGGAFAPVLVAPLILIYAVLFLDIKTFIAPNVINAARMQQDGGGSRLKFHVNIAISVVASIVVAIGYSIVLAYSRGAQQMNTWFYSNGPVRYAEQAARATTMTFNFEPATLGWFSAGASWVALTMILRRTIFWFPHPVGFLMNVNPLIAFLWFSFFLGWLCKKITVKYGGQMSFELMRQIMIGLIFGELTAILVVATINILPLGVTIPGIDLNRYLP